MSVEHWFSMGSHSPSDELCKMVRQVAAGQEKRSHRDLLLDACAEYKRVFRSNFSQFAQIPEDDLLRIKVAVRIVFAERIPLAKPTSQPKQSSNRGKGSKAKQTKRGMKPLSYPFEKHHPTLDDADSEKERPVLVFGGAFEMNRPRH